MREFLTMHPALVLVAPFVGIAIALVIAASLQRQSLFWRTISHNVEVAKQHLVAAKAFEREADLAAAGYIAAGYIGEQWTAEELDRIKRAAENVVPLVDSDSGDIEEMGEAEAEAFMAPEETEWGPFEWKDVVLRPTYSQYGVPCIIAEDGRGKVKKVWRPAFTFEDFKTMRDMRFDHELEMG